MFQLHCVSLSPGPVAVGLCFDALFGVVPALDSGFLLGDGLVTVDVSFACVHRDSLFGCVLCYSVRSFAYFARN